MAMTPKECQRMIDAAKRNKVKLSVGFQYRYHPNTRFLTRARDEGLVRNKAVYLAIGVDAGGCKHVLGMWIEQSEGAKFWLRVMNELKSRGTNDILIAVVDGLKGFPEAITAVFPQTVVQTCIVHLIRYSMQFASWKERKAIAMLKPVYRAENASGRTRAAGLRQGPWGRKYPAIAQSWRRNWEAVIPFFAFPAECARSSNDQRDREPERLGSQGRAQQRTLPERSGRHQAHLARPAPHHREVEATAYRMACCQGAAGNPIR
jgi:transposase-like protein